MTNLQGKTFRLRLVKTADERSDDVARIVREYMKDSVVRPAVDHQASEKVLRTWREAASSGR